MISLRQIRSTYFASTPMYSVVKSLKNKCLGFAVGSTAVAPPTTQPAAGLSCSCGKPAARQAVLRIRIRDPVPFWLLAGSGMGKISGSSPDHISESLETLFGVKIIKIFDADPGSVMERIRIWDPGSRMDKNSDPGSATLRKSICKSEIKGKRAWEFCSGFCINQTCVLPEPLIKFVCCKSVQIFKISITVHWLSMRRLSFRVGSAWGECWPSTRRTSFRMTVE